MSVNGGDFSDAPDTGDGDGDSPSVGRGYIRSIVAGLIASSVTGFLTWIAGGWLSVVEVIRSQIINVGQVISEQGGNVGNEIIDLVTFPIGLIGELATAAGPLAPILSAVIFALVAVITAAIGLALWRALVVIS